MTLGLEQPPITSDGRWLRDQTGRIVIMQGIFEGHKPLGLGPDDEEFADPDYAKRLRDSGINVTRMAYQWAGIEPEPGVFDQERIDRYRTMIERLSAEGIFTIIDSHQDMYGIRYGGNGFPDWATIDNGVPFPTDLGFPANYFQPATSHAFDNLWLNTDGILDAYADQLAVMASHFTADPYVLGYDLMNEPWAGSQYATCFKLEGCPQFDIAVLQPSMDLFARAVRSVDPDAIVFYEPQFTFDGGAKTWLGRPPEDVGPAAFSWHDLCISRALRQVFSSEELGDLLEQSCDAFHTQVYINAFEASVRMGVPPFMTEVLPANESDTGAMDCLLQRAEDNKMNWTAGTIGRYPELNDDNNVIALARVFPRAIAGEPLAYHFDVSTGTFTFTYRPDHEIAAPTLIGVPINVHYPNGYEVVVENGEVISPPNVVHLLIAAQTGAEQVGVTLQPAGDDSTVERPDFGSCDKPTDPIFDTYSDVAGALPVLSP